MSSTEFGQVGKKITQMQVSTILCNQRVPTQNQAERKILWDSNEASNALWERVLVSQEEQTKLVLQGQTEKTDLGTGGEG